MKKKTIALLVAVVLVVGCAVGGTLAWLTATTGEVKNTFTVGDVSITLTEDLTGTADETNPNVTASGEGYQYKAVPGSSYVKNPRVTVTAGSEKCYVFIEVTKSENFDTYYTVTMSENWKLLTGESNVYCYEANGSQIVDAGTAAQTLNILAPETVTVKSDAVTKDTMTEAAAQTITFRAYACQSDNVADAATAWSNIKSASPTA